MKVVLVAAVLLAVAHVGDAHDESIPETFYPVQFSQRTYNVTEGVNSNTVITVESTEDHNFPFTVFVVTRDGTARAGSDFIFSNVTVNFPAGVNSKTVYLPVIIDDEVVESTEIFSLCVDIEHNSYHLGVVDLRCAQVLISDTDIAYASFSPQNYTIPEGTPAELTIRLDKVCTFDVVFTVTTMDITAEDSIDYYGGTFPVKIPACDENAIQACKKEASVSVKTKRNSSVEADEDFKATLSLSPVLENVNIVVDTAYVTILDRTVPVKFSAATYYVTEGQSTVDITLEARVISAYSFYLFTVFVVTRDGTALGGDDYRDGSIPVTFEAFMKTATVTATIFDDEVAECPEEFFLDLEIPEAAAAIGAIKGSADSATVSIKDNEVATISFSPQNYTLQEGYLIELTIVLDRPFSCVDSQTGSHKTFAVTTRDGTAKSSSDYVGFSVSVSVPTGETTATQLVITEHNPLQETNEFFNAVLSLPVGLTSVQLGEDTAFVTICDSAIVEIRFSPQEYTVIEGDPVELIIALQEPSARSITFSVTTMDGTAYYNDDYFQDTIKVTVPPGETVTRVTVTTRKNIFLEGDEFFEAILSTSDECDNVVVQINTAYITILDTIPVPVRFNQTTYYVTEGVNSFAVITLEALTISAKSFNVYVTTRDGSAVARSDYRSFRRVSVTFPPGKTTASLTLRISNDLVAESTEELFLDLEIPPAAAAIGVAKVSPDNATVSITDDDVLVPVRFNQTTYYVTEGVNSSAVITLEALAIHNMSFSVIVTTRDGSAIAGFDYRSDYWHSRSTVTFTAGRNVSSFKINISNDLVAESTEEFFLDLEIPAATAAMGVYKASPDNARVNITDDDIPIPVRFNQTTYYVTEGVNSYAVITLEALAIPTRSFSVYVTTRDGSAVAGSDYSSSSWHTVSFTAARTVSSFKISISNDLVAESTEKFLLDLKTTYAAYEAGAIKGWPKTAVVSITDDDIPIRVWFNQTTYYVTEGTDSYAVITLKAFAIPTKSFYVYVTTRDGSAVASSDYGRSRSTVYFSATKLVSSFKINISNDEVVESTEEFFLDLEIPSHAVAAGAIKLWFGAATVIIADDDIPVPVRFNQTTYYVTEGVNSYAVITLEALAISAKSFNVYVTTQDGSAVARSDYGRLRRVQVTFPPGEKFANLALRIYNDQVAESTETLFLNLEIPAVSAAIGVYKVSPHNATVSIIDDDVAIASFSPQNYTYPEGTSVELMIVLDKVSTKDITFTVTTMDITAESPCDYKGGTFNVTIPACKEDRIHACKKEATLLVKTEQNSLTEVDEDFKATLSLSPGVENVDVVVDTAFITIVDTTVPVKFSAATYYVTEGQSTVDITLEALVSPTKAFTVNVVTRDGTALGGDDYRNGSIPVTFELLVETATVTVTIFDDEVAECPEEFSLGLEISEAAANMGVIKGSPDSATVSITDNDGYLECTFWYCKKKKNALCTKTDANGGCTCKVTSCMAAYYSRNERPPPAQCSRRNKCAGLTGEILEKCLRKWGKCVKNAFKAQHGNTPAKLHKDGFFKTLEYPCSG